MHFRSTDLHRSVTETAGRGQTDAAVTRIAGTPPSSSARTSLPRLWTDGLGRAGTRAAQILLVGAVVAALVYAVSRLSIVTVPLMLALVLAAAFAPWMEWTGRRRLPRALGAALAIMLLLAAVTLAVAFVVGSVSHQWHELAIQAQAGLERVEAPLQALPFSPDQRQSGDVTEQIRGLLTNGDVRSRTLGGLAAIGDLGASLGLTVIILFFLLKDGPQMWEFLLRPLTGTAFDRAERIRRRTVGVFGGYIGSTAGAALFDAAGVFVGLLILRVPLAAPLAILTFLLAFIPIVGAVSAGAIAAMVALVTNGPLSAALVVLVVLVVDHVEGSVLKPVLMGKTVSLPAFVVLVALAGGAAVGGVIGALLAVPLTAAAWGAVQVWDGDDLPARWARPKPRDRSSDA